MFVTIINDCQCGNAQVRQSSRVARLFGVCPSFVGVKNDTEAAGNLIDVLDATEGERGVVLVNVAPRNGKAKRWSNGTPFGYFFYQKTLVLLSVDGYTLSLVKKLGLCEQVEVLDIPQVAERMKSLGNLTRAQAKQIVATQFRSFEFLPRVSKWLFDGQKFETEKLAIKEIADMPETIWWVDNFGNCKTSILAGEFDFEKIGKINPQLKDLELHQQLKDLEDGELALVVGSSGLKNDRFVEVMKQGGRAVDELV